MDEVERAENMKRMSHEILALGDGIVESKTPKTQSIITFPSSSGSELHFLKVTLGWCRFILFHVNDIIKAKPCLQDGRRKKWQKYKFMIKKWSEGPSGRPSAVM